jgi:hypothetical protein
MKSIQKVLLSLLISVVAAGFFYLAGIFGLFETLEYVFYETRIQERVANDLVRTEALLNQFEDDIASRTDQILRQQAFQQAFLINQTATLIQQRRQIIQESFSLTPGLTSLRIFEPDFSRLFYSTRISDIIESSAQRIVYRPVVDIEDLTFIQSLVPESLEYDLIYVIDPSNNLFYIIRPVFDQVNILRGHGVFIGTFRPFENRLIQNGLLPVDRSSFFLNEDIFIVNIDDSIKSALQLIDVNLLQTTEGFFGRVDIDSNRFVFLSHTGLTYTFATLIPEQELLLSEPLQWFLVILIFSSVFLFVFLLLNLRHDSVVIITDRIKRFQISLVQEYLENKENLDLHKWKTELRLRKDDVYKQILKGIPKRKRNDKALEQLLDASWEEILDVLGSKKLLASGTSQLDIERIEQAMQRVVSSLQHVELTNKSISQDQSGTKPTAKPIAKKTSPKKTSILPDTSQPIEVEVISQGKNADLDGDLEELDELDELTEAEEIEEFEAEEENLESAEELEEIEEIAELEELEDAEELEEVEAEEVEDLESVEDLDQIEELAEIDELEESDEVEEVDEAEELDEIKEVDQVEELEQAEELEEAEDVEDFEDVEDVEDVEELEELFEIENSDELEEVIDKPRVTKQTKEEQLISALDEDALESIEQVQDSQRVQPVHNIHDEEIDDDIDELEELSELEELEELDEETGELVSELGTPSVTARNVEHISEDQEETDNDQVEEAIELESEHYTDSLVNMASYLQSPLWSRTMNDEQIEDLEPMELLDEEIESEASVPVFLLASFESLLSKEEQVFTTNEDGIIRISDSVYSSQDNQQEKLSARRDDDSASESYETDTPNSDENEDLFGIPDIDFDMPTISGNNTEADSVTAPRYYRKKEYGEIKFSRKGFDFDAFAATFRKDGPGRVKSLVTLSRLLNSRFAAIFTENDRGIYFKSGVGYSTEVSPMSPEDPLFQYYLKRDSITLLDNATTYNYLMPQHEKTMGTLKQLIFVPCLYEGESGFVILGPSEELKKPEEFLSYFEQLITQPIESN